VSSVWLQGKKTNSKVNGLGINSEWLRLGLGLWFGECFK
jgi:hypothetical protein